jgi:hypothetical protein
MPTSGCRPDPRIREPYVRLYLAVAGFVLVCASPPSAAELPIHKAGLTLFDDIITRMEMARGFERGKH